MTVLLRIVLMEKQYTSATLKKKFLLAYQEQENLQTLKKHISSLQEQTLNLQKNCHLFFQGMMCFMIECQMNMTMTIMNHLTKAILKFRQPFRILQELLLLTLALPLVRLKLMILFMDGHLILQMVGLQKIILSALLCFLRMFRIMGTFEKEYGFRIILGLLRRAMLVIQNILVLKNLKIYMFLIQ